LLAELFVRHAVAGFLLSAFEPPATAVPSPKGAALDLLSPCSNVLQMKLAMNQHLLEAVLTSISPNITLSGQVDLIINGYAFL
jgi:hypothetical protein